MTPVLAIPQTRDFRTYCRQLTCQSGSNFYYSFRLLPKPKREAMFAVYAYCREIDDVVDGESSRSEKLEVIEWWRREIDECFAGKPHHPISRAISASCERFPLPKQRFQDLLEGFEMDVARNRYATFEELEQYCFRVASAVGMICIEIFEYQDAWAREYAEKLGKALQITNILRDVPGDLKQNRLYLPEEDMEKFGVSEADLRADKVTSPIRELFEFEWNRAGEFFKECSPERLGSDRANFFPAEIMGRIYQGLWREIRRREFDVFSTRIQVSSFKKISIAFQVYLASLTRGLNG